MAGENENSGMKFIGTLWKSKTKAGQNMLSGVVGKHLKIVILPNKYKQPGDNLPDVNIFFTEPTKKEKESYCNQNSTPSDDSSVPPIDSDIPF